MVCFAGNPGTILHRLPEEEGTGLKKLWDRAVEIPKERGSRWSGYRSYILEEALASGWLRYEEGKTPDTVGAYLYR